MQSLLTIAQHRTRSTGTTPGQVQHQRQSAGGGRGQQVRATTKVRRGQETGGSGTGHRQPDGTGQRPAPIARALAAERRAEGIDPQTGLFQAPGEPGGIRRERAADAGDIADAGLGMGDRGVAVEDGGAAGVGAGTALRCPEQASQQPQRGVGKVRHSGPRREVRQRIASLALLPSRNGVQRLRYLEAVRCRCRCRNRNRVRTRQRQRQRQRA